MRLGHAFLEGFDPTTGCPASPSLSVPEPEAPARASLASRAQVATLGVRGWQAEPVFGSFCPAFLQGISMFFSVYHHADSFVDSASAAVSNVSFNGGGGGAA